MYRYTEFDVAQHHITAVVIVVVISAQRRISADFIEFVIRYVSARRSSYNARCKYDRLAVYPVKERRFKYIF